MGRKHPNQRFCRPCIEHLEERSLLATIVGDISLPPAVFDNVYYSQAQGDLEVFRDINPHETYFGAMAAGFSDEYEPEFGTNHAILEFATTAVHSTPKATLELANVNSGGDIHASWNFELYGYVGDGAVTREDYDRPATFITSFTGEAATPFSLDVTSFLNSALQQHPSFIGFRIEGIGDSWAIFGNSSNPMALKISLDPRATDIQYIPGSTVADDKIQVTYDVGGLPENQNLALSLYWSINGELSLAGARGLAYSTTAAEHDGEMEIPISALNPRPNAPIETTHLLLHVDDIPGGSADGNITTAEGDIDTNNYKSRYIVPEINPTDLTWNYDEGGLDVSYELQNRAFIDKPIVVQMMWAGSGPSHAAGSNFVVSRDQRTHPVPWEDITPPQIGDERIELKFDPQGDISEQNDSPENNTVREEVGDWKPNVFFVIPPAFRKERYDVSVTVKNTAPIGIDIELFFKETVPSEVFEKAPLNRQSEPVKKALGFGSASSEITFKLSQLDLNGPFIRSWNWIPPENFSIEAQKLLGDYTQGTLTAIVQEMAAQAKKETLSDSIALVSGVNDIYELIQQFADPQPLIPTVDVSYQMNAKALVGKAGQTRDAADLVTLFVPQKRKDFLAEFQRAAGTAKVLNNLAIGLAVETGGLSGALLVPGLLTWQQARELYRQAVDPPSSDYMRLAELHVDDALLDRYTSDPLVRSFALQRLKLVALTKAIADTEDRVLGAQAAGDTFWEARQHEALSDFQHQAALEGLRGVGLTGFLEPWLAATLSNLGANSQNSGSGLPSALREELIALGASADELELIEASADNDALRSPGGAELLVWFDVHAALLNARGALGSLEEAVALRTQFLGQPIQTVSPEALSELSATRVEIQEQLSGGAATEHARQLIEQYLTSARSLLVETNNLGALQEVLEFGYGALVRLQLTPPGVKSLEEFVEAQAGTGAITQDVAALLQDSLEQVKGLVASGKFVEATQAWDAFHVLVTSNSGAGINAAVASQLADFASYSEAFGSVDVATYDFGDLPEPAGGNGSYATVLAKNGARHKLGSPLFLGVRVDAEPDGQPHASALGDDNDASGDDEDGVALPSALIAGLTASVTVTASAAGRLDAWIDFDGSGSFDAGEQIAASVPLSAGANTVAFTVPQDAIAGTSYARFRLSSAGGLGPTGPAADGEVEDYQVQIQALVPGTAVLAADPLDSAHKILIVTGTSRNDSLLIEPRPRNQLQVRAKISGKLLGIFGAPLVARIAVFGLQGNDVIVIDPRLSVPTELHGNDGNDSLFGGGGKDRVVGEDGNDSLFGGSGDDSLWGGNGNDSLAGGKGNDMLYGELGEDLLQGEAGLDVLLGGLGNDKMFGGTGRDLLIGGLGRDRLSGQEDDDILIGSTTTHDNSAAALQAILSEWNSANGFPARIASLATLLNAATVSDDGVRDELDGGAGRDWFLDFALADTINGFSPSPKNGDRKN